MELIFLLLFAHALADFALQSDVMAKGKNRHNKGVPPPGAKYVPCWPYWLSSHALIHGGAVALATGRWEYGAAEAGVHWITDFGKCENWYGVHFDQAVHILSKVAWVAGIAYAT